MTLTQVNVLNMALMVGSCLLAFPFPFELFLFSYAVLGPLHYVTEISWLHDRRYFTASGPGPARPHRGWLTLVGLTLVALVAGLVATEGLGTTWSPLWEITPFYLVFVSALLVTEVRGRAVRGLTALGALVGLALLTTSRYYVVLAFLLVTIIHVLVFTGAFVLHGALRGRSVSGGLSLAVYALCALTFFVYAPADPGAGEYVRASYRSFTGLNVELLRLLGLGGSATATDVYQSASGLMVMRLIAFAYTYHYLNWFSKTSIIRWHEVPKRRTAVMIAVWLGAVALYGWDYDRGMALLSVMSVLHVMLEFPLNHRTFAGIGRELAEMAGRLRATPGADLTRRRAGSMTAPSPSRIRRGGRHG